MERLKILLVDDEEDLVSAMAERLMLRGFQATWVCNATAALRLLRENQFGAVILDVKMPGTGGLKLLLEIKEEYPSLPVILFTGHGSTVDAERGTQEGAFDYLMKPVEIEDLVETIYAAVGATKGSHA
jgi:two-component system, OmpR family, response regulator